MLRFIISFGLALCGHLYLLQYSLDLRLDTPPQLISDASVSVTLNQALVKKMDTPQKKSTWIEKLEPLVKPPLTPPPQIKSHDPFSKKNSTNPIPIKNNVQKKKKIIQPPKPEEMSSESALVKKDNSFKKVTRQQAQKKQTQDLVETASSVIKARPLYQYNPKPEYPNLARRRGWEGIVHLLVEVTARGDVASVRLNKTCGYTILDKSALRAVKTWHFKPGVRDGKQSQSTILIPVHFKLQK